MLRFEELFEIPSPCDEFLSDDPGERASYCHACEREILNLSALTRGEATALVQSDLHCVSYWVDARGEVIFAPEPSPPHVVQSAQGALRHALWRNAAVLTLPMLLAACEPEVETQRSLASSVEPVSWTSGEVQPGAGRAPEGLRLGVVKNKVDRVKPRYSKDVSKINPKTLDVTLSALSEEGLARPVTFKRAMNDVELLHYERRAAHVRGRMVRRPHPIKLDIGDGR